MYEVKVLLIIVLVLSIASVSNALNVIYVDVNGPNDPGIGTSKDPFRKIQDAIDAAVNGDIIEVRPGIYTADSNNYNLDPNGKSITIRSTEPNDPETIANTIIDPNGAGRGFYFHSGEGPNCAISGLTIRNAVASSSGAGIFCYNSSPTVRNCVIQGGHAEDSGGGLCLYYSSAIVINCTITGNVADYYGGGIGCSFSAPMITGCSISGNTAGHEGGGLDSGMSEPNIFNCVIIDNNAPVGGGINCYWPSVTHVVNCTLAANSADNFGGAVHCWSGGIAIVENSILWANSASVGTQVGLLDDGIASLTYCDVQGGQTDVYDPCSTLVWGSGNIDIDPCFAAFDPNGDPNVWDFHLKSIYGRWNSSIYYEIDLVRDGFIDLFDFAVFATFWQQEGNTIPVDFDDSGVVDFLDLMVFVDNYLMVCTAGAWVFDQAISPCIDAGAPNSDWGDEPWPNGRRINMGVYGGTNQASKNGNPADFDIDGSVNFVDFAGFADKWLGQESCIEDLNKNGMVDFADLGIFAKNWLWQKE